MDTEIVRYAKETTQAVFDAGWKAGVLAGQVEVLNETLARLETMITIDYAGTFDDRRGLEALRDEMRAKLTVLHEQAAGSPG